MIEFQPIRDVVPGAVPPLTKEQNKDLALWDDELFTYMAKTAAHEQYRDQVGTLALKAMVALVDAAATMAPRFGFGGPYRH